jgi:protein-S-isoprenylcysteine O-methyltransferase Ste14
MYFTDYRQFTDDVGTALTVISVVLSLSGFVIRAYAIGTTPAGTSGRNTNEQIAESLNQTGIYSVVRHPLYLGNYLMWIGIVMFTFNLYFIMIVSLAYWLYYERIMFAEERFLERKFGEHYLTWSQKVPAFIPRFQNFIPSVIPFSLKSVLRREYSGLLATVLGFAFVDHLRYFLINGNYKPFRVSSLVLIILSVIAILLRTLKHKTHTLDEEGRW